MSGDIRAFIKIKLQQIGDRLQQEMIFQMSIQTMKIDKLIRGLAITINKQNMILERLDDIETKIQEVSKERE